jgi:hypothetical protein
MVELHDISVDFLFRESVQVKSSWSNAQAAQSPRAGTLPQAGHARVGSVTPPSGLLVTPNESFANKSLARSSTHGL